MLTGITGFPGENEGPGLCYPKSKKQKKQRKKQKMKQKKMQKKKQGNK